MKKLILALCFISGLVQAMEPGMGISIYGRMLQSDIDVSEYHQLKKFRNHPEVAKNAIYFGTLIDDQLIELAPFFREKIENMNIPYSWGVVFNIIRSDIRLNYCPYQISEERENYMGVVMFCLQKIIKEKGFIVSHPTMETDLIRGEKRLIFKVTGLPARQ